MDARGLPQTDTAAGLYLLTSGLILLGRGVTRYWKNVSRGLQNELVWLWFRRIQYSTDQATGAWLASFYALCLVIVLIRFLLKI